MACIELVTFPASKAFLANRSSGDPILEALGDAPGVVSVHYGFAVEDDRTVYLPIGWESIEHNTAYRRSPEYASLLPSLLPFMAGPRVTPHIYFDGDLASAFNAPFTEFASFTLKEGQSRDELLSVLQKMRTGIDQVFSLKYAPCALGKCVENPETFYLVAGWDNVADHTDVLKRKEVIPLTSRLMELSELKVQHVPLKAIKNRGDDLKARL